MKKQILSTQVPTPNTPPAPGPRPTETRDHASLDTRHPPLDTSLHPRRRRGRPSRFTEELADSIYDAIRFYGFSDTAAAAEFGIGASTIARWKQDNEDLKADFEAARVEFRKKAIDKIWNATKRNGDCDWRAIAWMLERIFPDDYGRRARQDVEPEIDYTTGDGKALFALTPDYLECLRQRREAALRADEEAGQGEVAERARALFEKWKQSYNPANPNARDPSQPRYDVPGWPKRPNPAPPPSEPVPAPAESTAPEPATPPLRQPARKLPPEPSRPPLRELPARFTEAFLAGREAVPANESANMPDPPPRSE
jgi:hypothetical protein